VIPWQNAEPRGHLLCEMRLTGQCSRVHFYVEPQMVTPLMTTDLTWPSVRCPPLLNLPTAFSICFGRWTQDQGVPVAWLSPTGLPAGPAKPCFLGRTLWTSAPSSWPRSTPSAFVLAHRFLFGVRGLAIPTCHVPSQPEHRSWEQSWLWAWNKTHFVRTPNYN
jgi:hypothetical protein